MDMLAETLDWLTDNLISRIPILIPFSEAKVCLLDMFRSIYLYKLNNFLFQYYLYFYTNIIIIQNQELE